MTSDSFLNEYIEKKLIKPEKIGLDQIEKVIKSAEKDLKVAEKLLSIREFVKIIKDEIQREHPQINFKF